MWQEVLSHTWKLYLGIHEHFQTTSEALALQVSQNTHQCLQIPDKISLQLSAEISLNFYPMAHWKRWHFSLEVRVNFRGEMPCHLSSKRRHTLTRPSNSCCRSQMRIDVRPEPFCLTGPRYLPPIQEDRV